MPGNQICSNLNTIRLITIFNTNQTNTKPGIISVSQNGYK